MTRISIAFATLAAVALAGPARAAPAKPAAPAVYPKPYTPKSKRDFSGLWERVGGIAWDPEARGPSRTAPLTPEYQTIFAQRLKDAADGKPTGDPTSACYPQGMPRMMTMTYPMEIMQNERQVNIFAEWNEQTRRIFIDGRPHPPADELDPTYYGHSIGHWEGDVLVADTVGIRGDTNLEASGLPHSDALTVKERIWLAEPNLLKDEITLVDPKAFTHPWTVTKAYKRMAPGQNLLPYVCLENQRNPVDQNGVIGFVHEGGSR